ncbi:MAG: ABC transporter permease [Thaumarchaeota archaeon]|nr:ABC transporter permease [Nitrososphaerota archaeon]
MKFGSIDWGMVYALVRKDASNWSSYKLQIVIAILGALIGFTSWGFNAAYRDITVPFTGLFPTPVYQISYLSFIVSGILVSNVVLSLTGGVTSGLRPWMLESILMTGIRPATFVLGTVAWSYFLSLVFFFPQLLIGLLFFNVSLDVNPLSLIISIMISGVMVFGLSMASVGVRLVTKITDPINWVLGISMALLSGQTFPVQYLNNYFPGITYVSWALPYTWVFIMIRLSTLTGASIFDPGIAIPMLIGLVYAAVLVPAGLYFFRWGLRRAKKQGTLGFY